MVADVAARQATRLFLGVTLLTTAARGVVLPQTRKLTKMLIERKKMTGDKSKENEMLSTKHEKNNDKKVRNIK